LVEAANYIPDPDDDLSNIEQNGVGRF